MRPLRVHHQVSVRCSDEGEPVAFYPIWRGLTRSSLAAMIFRFSRHARRISRMGLGLLRSSPRQVL